MAENDNNQGSSRDSRTGKSSSGRPYKGQSSHRQSRSRADRHGRPTYDRSGRTHDRYRSAHDESHSEERRSYRGDRPNHRDSQQNNNGKNSDGYRRRSSFNSHGTYRHDGKYDQERRTGNRAPRGDRGYHGRSSHAPRGGKNRDYGDHPGSHNRPAKGPQIPDWVDPSVLPGDVRRELHMLSKENADRVASHMIASYGLLDEDPDAALAHAHAARDHAGRIAVVREHAGIIAYLTGHWQEALSELRTARRIGGGPGLLSIMADCERGLGRPERAIEMLNSEYVPYLDDEGRAELLIVVAGARADMGQHDAAVVVLEEGNLDPTQTGETAARYFYAYADALLAAGRRDDAITWFRNAASIDEEAATDAMQRLDDLES